MTSFNISYGDDLLMVNHFSFCICKIFFHFALIIGKYLHSFSFSTLRMFLHCLLACIVFDKKSSVILIFVSLLLFFVFLISFKIFSLTGFEQFNYGRPWCGEGNGIPFQYSCLENPMDGGAW